jgi:fructose-bisphosphate aldolase class 1
MKNMNDQVKEMRARIVEFVKLSGGQAERSAIKEHLGLDQWDFSEIFNRALKTTKLTPIYGRGEISPGLFLRVKPVITYKLT